MNPSCFLVLFAKWFWPSVVPLHWVLQDLSLSWCLSPALLLQVEGFWDSCETANPITLLLTSHGKGACQGIEATLPAPQSLEPLLTSLLAPFSSPWSKLTGGENRSLYEHLLQDIKNYWAVIFWMRLTTNPLSGCSPWPVCVITAHQLPQGEKAFMRRWPPKPRLLPLQDGHGHLHEYLTYYCF